VMVDRPQLEIGAFQGAVGAVAARVGGT
jgi:hypothetical protein